MQDQPQAWTLSSLCLDSDPTPVLPSYDISSQQLHPAPGKKVQDTLPHLMHLEMNCPEREVKDKERGNLYKLKCAHESSGHKLQYVIPASCL